jgi:plasmid stability protein
MQSACAYHLPMPVAVQIRNVPDDLHRTLKARAARAGMSLSEYLLAELADVAELPTAEEMLERLRRRSPVQLTESAADAVRAEREAR